MTPRIALLEAVTGFVLVVAGAALIFWPAALVVAGALLLIDRATNP